MGSGGGELNDKENIDKATAETTRRIEAKAQADASIHKAEHAIDQFRQGAVIAETLGAQRNWPEMFRNVAPENLAQFQKGLCEHATASIQPVVGPEWRIVLDGNMPILQCGNFTVVDARSRIFLPPAAAVPTQSVPVATTAAFSSPSNTIAIFPVSQELENDSTTETAQNNRDLSSRPAAPASSRSHIHEQSNISAEQRELRWAMLFFERELRAEITRQIGQAWNLDATYETDFSSTGIRSFALWNDGHRFMFQVDTHGSPERSAWEVLALRNALGEVARFGIPLRDAHTLSFLLRTAIRSAAAQPAPPAVTKMQQEKKEAEQKNPADAQQKEAISKLNEYCRWLQAQAGTSINLQLEAIDGDQVQVRAWARRGSAITTADIEAFFRSMNVRTSMRADGVITAVVRNDDRGRYLYELFALTLPNLRPERYRQLRNHSALAAFLKRQNCHHSFPVAGVPMIRIEGISVNDVFSMRSSLPSLEDASMERNGTSYTFPATDAATMDVQVQSFMDALGRLFRSPETLVQEAQPYLKNIRAYLSETPPNEKAAREECDRLNAFCAGSSREALMVFRRSLGVPVNISGTPFVLLEGFPGITFDRQDSVKKRQDEQEKIQKGLSRELPERPEAREREPAPRQDTLFVTMNSEGDVCHEYSSFIRRALGLEDAAGLRLGRARENPNIAWSLMEGEALSPVIGFGATTTPREHFSIRISPPISNTVQRFAGGHMLRQLRAQFATARNSVPRRLVLLATLTDPLLPERLEELNDWRATFSRVDVVLIPSSNFRYARSSDENIKRYTEFVRAIHPGGTVTLLPAPHANDEKIIAQNGQILEKRLRELLSPLPADALDRQRPQEQKDKKRKQEEAKKKQAS